MKTELMLTDILPYLSHRLRCQTINSAGNTDEWEIMGFKGEAVHLKGSPYYCDISDIRPLLRPIGADFENEISEDDLAATSCNSRLRLIAMCKTNSLYHFQFEYLVSKHFDIFGLIEQELAISKIEISS